MEYLNETYEAVDNQSRPVSYINPCVIRDSCTDEENYETLTEVQTQFNNIYEHLPNAGGDTLQRTTNETKDFKLKKKDHYDDSNARPFDEKEIMKIKQDLRKTKASVIILALFVVVLLVTSLIAVALAVTIPQRHSIENQLEPDGPQAVIAPDNPSTQGMDKSTRQMITNLSSELQKLQDTLNTTIRRLNSEHSELMEQTRQNYSDVASQLDNLGSVFISQSDQLRRLIQRITNQSNATCLVNQVITLQDQSQQMQSKITQAEGHIGDLMLMQSNLFNATHSNLTQVRHQISNIQNELSTNQREVEVVDARVRAVQGQLTTTQANVTSLNRQMNTVRQQLNDTQTNIAFVRSQASSLQTSLDNYLSSPIELYRSCHQDTAACSVSNLADNNRRLFCNTPVLNANITGFYTLDMRCEYSGATDLEAPSLQKTSTSYFCQCSIVTPSSTGRFTRLSTPSSPGTCTLVVTRCPLSQTIT